MAQATCQAMCNRQAIFYVTAKTSVPMRKRWPVCTEHAAMYGRQAVEVATVSSIPPIFTVEVKLEVIEVADLLDRHAVLLDGEVLE